MIYREYRDNSFPHYLFKELYMSNANIRLDLKSRRDKTGQTYFIAKLKGPFTIDCSKGAVFLVFTSDPGAEELQIAPMEENGKDE
jgi:hypothetical protein